MLVQMRTTIEFENGGTNLDGVEKILKEGSTKNLPKGAGAITQLALAHGPALVGKPSTWSFLEELELELELADPWFWDLELELVRPNPKFLELELDLVGTARNWSELELIQTTRKQEMRNDL
ncbi:hypothetical protein LXL04_011695 [Taraxacum kok-saghyz]